MFYDQGDATHKSELMRKVRDFYFGKEERIDTIEKFENYTNLFSDWVWHLGLSDSIRFHSQYSSEVYAYYFAYQGEISFTTFLMTLKGKYWAVVEVLIYVVKCFLGYGNEYEGKNICSQVRSYLLYGIYISFLFQGYLMGQSCIYFLIWVLFLTYVLHLRITKCQRVWLNSGRISQKMSKT